MRCSKGIVSTESRARGIQPVGKVYSSLRGVVDASGCERSRCWVHEELQVSISACGTAVSSVVALEVVALERTFA